MVNVCCFTKPQKREQDKEKQAQQLNSGDNILLFYIHAFVGNR